MFFILKKIFLALEVFFFPYSCIICLERSDQARDLCHPCESRLVSSPCVCLQCGRILSINACLKKCGQCIKNPPYYDYTLFGFNYQPPVSIWLKQFKFHKKTMYARILTEIYAEKLAAFLNMHPEYKPDALLALPLHWRRRMKRGFNQSYIIARYLSQRLSIPILPSNAVFRIKHRPPQSSLKKSMRQSNVKNIFQVNSNLKINHLVIVDDVLTTGSTVNELAFSLKKELGFPLLISVWVLARGVSEGNV